MKPLKPTMRENKRYLLVEGSDLRKNIEKAILDFIGVLGFSKIGIEWIKEDKNSAVISVNREMVDSVRASLCIWPKKMEVKMVSGTLKGLRTKVHKI
jgi:RNase P/RNase MRP subunit POP5